MTTLRIEHAISDFDVWRQAFDRFADARRNAGVLGFRVFRPVDDLHYVLIDLDFETAEHATQFLRFLESSVWSVPENAPALAGSPETRIIETVDAG